ncbi:hypothetical protein P7C70_g209, partial [Phenoliferia sp. Uapishka_3]
MPPAHNTSSVPSPRQSPRSRRASRPLPFTLAMPPPSASFHLFDPHSNSPSRPQSPSFHRNTVIQLHEALYGGAGKDRDVISALVWDMYDTNAGQLIKVIMCSLPALNLVSDSVFESPVTMARGQEQIVDLFALLGVVPGEMWSELGDVCESQSYLDGSRLVTMSHILHYRLLGSQTSSDPSTSSELRASDSFYSYSSTPSTPFGAHGFTDVAKPSYNPTHHTTSEDGRWPLSHILRQLRPRNIIDHLSTINIKLYSRLEFNEQGKIVFHEDVVGIRETIEGVFPILGHVYALNRQGLGFLASSASRVLFRQKPPDHEAQLAVRRTRSALNISTTPGYHHHRISRESTSPSLRRKSLPGGEYMNGCSNELGLEDLEAASFGVPVASVDPDECYNTE